MEHIKSFEGFYAFLEFAVTGSPCSKNDGGGGLASASPQLNLNRRPHLELQYYKYSSVQYLKVKHLCLCAMKRLALKVGCSSTTTEQSGICR